MYTDEHARRAQELEQDIAWSTRERRRDNVRMLIGIVCSLVIALPVMMMSARVTDEAIGRVFLYGGLALGYIGVFASVIWGLQRSVKRGDTHW